MKRLFALIPIAFVVLTAGPAAAHQSAQTVTTACVDGQPIATVTFDNDFAAEATVEIGGQTLTLPPLGTVTYSVLADGSTLAWTVTWADEFSQSGTVLLPLGYEGCVRIPTTTTVAPTTTAPSTTVAPTTVAPLPPITTAPPTEVLTSSVQTAAAPELAFTGARTVALTIAGFVLVAFGSAIAYAARQTRKAQS